MKNKKAQVTSTTQDILIGLIAGAVFAVIFFYASNAFGSILQKQKVDCSNSKWWNSERGLKDILKDVDKGEYAEFMLYNDDCNLVSFSFIQGINKIEFPHAQTKEPMLCLCKIEDKTCKPYNCHKFKNYDQINTEQFSTENLESYVFLKFEKEGKTLRINAVGTEKPIEPVTYTKQETQTKTDETNLINKMVVRFTSRDIKSFTPIVKIQKEKGLLLPEGIENIEDFTMFFDIDLAYPPSYGQAEEEYLTKHESIDKDKVKEVFIEINIPKDKFNKLTFNQQENLKLYYKKEQKWEGSKLKCDETDKTILCNTIIKGFSKNFAISTTSLQEIEEQENVGEQISTITQTPIFLLNDFNLQGASIVKDYIEKPHLPTSGFRELSDVKLIVLHHTGGYKATGTISTLEKRGLSVHYILDKNGDLYYLIPENEISWHAGCCKNKNYNTITKEWLSGCCQELTYEGEIICKKRFTFCREGINSMSIGIEIVNTGKPGDPITTEQYNTLNQILPYLTEKLNLQYNDNTIIAHYEVTNNKNDPINFVWNKINLPNHKTYEQFKQTYTSYA